MPRLIQAVIAGNRPSEIFASEQEASLAALKRLKPGDCLVITSVIVEESLNTWKASQTL